MKWFVAMVLSVLGCSANALSIPVSSDLVNHHVQKAFPKEIKKVHLSEPKVVFEGSKAKLCMQVQVKLGVVQSAPFSSCSLFEPTWNGAAGRAEARGIVLQEVKTENGAALPSWILNLVSTQVLPMVEPLVIYESGGSLLGKAIDRLEIKDNRLHIHF